jgi:hypothetical protein
MAIFCFDQTKGHCPSPNTTFCSSFAPKMEPILALKLYILLAILSWYPSPTLYPIQPIPWLLLITLNPQLPTTSRPVRRPNDITAFATNVEHPRHPQPSFVNAVLVYVSSSSFLRRLN